MEGALHMHIAGKCSEWLSILLVCVCSHTLNAIPSLPGVFLLWFRHGWDALLPWKLYKEETLPAVVGYLDGHAQCDFKNMYRGGKSPLTSVSFPVLWRIQAAAKLSTCCHYSKATTPKELLLPLLKCWILLVFGAWSEEQGIMGNASQTTLYWEPYLN